MSDERRYADDEVAEIFKAAADPRGAEGRAPAPAAGFSLAELQAIGGEAGLSPERIAEAAAALELRRGALPRRTELGVPVAVGRTVELPRALTDHEWARLVAELRHTFGARGRDWSAADLRSWANGNLHAYVEPSETGYRLRMGTVHGNGLALGRVGIAWMLIGLALLAFVLLAGGAATGAVTGVIVAAVGLLAFGGNALRLPGWADERERQMEHIAARALALTRAPADAGADAT